MEFEVSSAKARSMYLYPYPAAPSFEDQALAASYIVEISTLENMVQQIITNIMEARRLALDLDASPTDVFGSQYILPMSLCTPAWFVPLHHLLADIQGSL